MTRFPRQVVLAIGVVVAAAPVMAQSSVWELGLDAGATFGLGDVSSIQIRVPASRFRAGCFLSDGRWSIEPAFGLGYNKVEDVDGVFTYDVEVGALYHFKPFAIVTQDENEVVARVSSSYIRPFVGLSGFTGGNADDSEFSLGTGLGLAIPWRQSLAWRLEGNLGYGFDNDAFRIGLLAGVSFFTR
jgi:hypothetical protein